MPERSARSWFAVHTHPRGEECAARNIDRQGFETYLPRYIKTRRHARRADVVAAPFFPRYLFVSVDMETQRWRAINSSLGVVRIVGRSDAPTVVSPAIITALKARETAAGFITVSSPLASLRPGSPVYVTEGPFADCSGLFEAVTENQRVQILLDLLGRKVRVALDERAIGIA